MNNLNTVLMEGTLIRDPERSNQVTGSSQCRLSLANNRYYNGKNEKWVHDASFFTVWVFGPVAESCLTYLRKGRGIRVVGRLKQFRYTSAGFSREKVAILAEHIEFQPQKKVEDPAAAEVPRIPGEMTTRADSSIELEKQEQEREAAQRAQDQDQHPDPAEIHSDAPAETEGLQSQDDEDFAHEDTRTDDDAVPECSSEEDVPETKTSDDDQPF